MTPSEAAEEYGESIDINTSRPLTDEEFATIVIELRKGLDLTGRDFARCVQVNPSTVFRWESGYSARTPFGEAIIVKVYDRWIEEHEKNRAEFRRILKKALVDEGLYPVFEMIRYGLYGLGAR